LSAVWLRDRNVAGCRAFLFQTTMAGSAGHPPGPADCPKFGPDRRKAMKTLILASVAALAFGGAAIAQEAPTLYGDVSPSTANSEGVGEVVRGQATPVPDLGIDVMRTNSVEPERADGSITLKDATNPSDNDNISGK
jgi:hypothetical protein